MDTITVPAIGLDGRVEQQTVPFVIGVLADLSGDRGVAGQALSERRFAVVDEATFDGGDGEFAPDAATRDSKREAAQIGVRYLTTTLGSLSNIRIKIADLSKSELCRDLMRARGSDASWLYRRLVDDAYSSSDGQPFAVLIVDYEFNNDPRDLEMLDELATIAAASFVQVLAAAGPGMFGLSRFEELRGIRKPERVFDGADYARWRRFRDNESARYVVLTMPQAMVRQPRTADPRLSAAAGATDRFEAAAYGVMNAAYLLGGRLAELFSVSDWWIALNLSEGKFHFDPQLPRRAGIGPGEVPISAEQEVRLARAGFAVLTGDGAEFAFHAPMTAQRPPRYDDPQATRIAETVVQIINVMAASRMTHHIRKAAEHFARWAPSPEDLEHMLDDWIGRYVRVIDMASGAPVDRSRPLAGARIELRSPSGSSERCVVVAWLRFGLPSDAPYGTVNNRVVFALRSVRWAQAR